MNRLVKSILALVIIVVILFLILNSKFSFTGTEEAAGRSPGGPAAKGPVSIPVAATVIEPDILNNEIKVTGSLMANEFIELKSEISGKISRIHFNEGQKVRKGQLLISINVEELQAQLEKLKFSQKLYEDSEFRQRRLLEKEAISQEEYDIALTELNTSLADIKVLEAQIDKSIIRAPFSGTIGLRQVSEGSYIIPSTVIANLFSINPIKIEFSVPGKYSGQVKNGQKIEFSMENSSQKFIGEIYAIEPQIDPATRTLSLRAISENPDDELLPGQFVNITLNLAEIENALMVPTVSVIPELNGHRVFRYHSGKAESVPVEIGIRTENSVQVLNGLDRSDTIITTGILQLREGSSVNITNLN
jgi:membrane fusion protein (multidrug efflux system)